MNTIISLDVTHKYHDVYSVTRLFSKILESMHCRFKMVEVDFIQDTFDKETILNATGVIISGSKYSVNDRLDWIDDARALIRKLDENSIPVLGICFGHQLIATAFGGQVVRMKNYEVGPYKIQLTNDGRQDPIFSRIRSGTKFLFSHFDHVAKLPADAVPLAGTDLDPNSAFKLRDMRGVQCHPELTGSLLSALMIQHKDAFKQNIRESDSEWRDRANKISRCNVTGDILLQNFYQFVFELASIYHSF